MSFKHKVVSNIFYNFLSILTISISGYIFWIISGKFLVPEDYGALSLIVAIYTFALPLACWGMNVALRRFIPIYQSKNNTQKIRDIVYFSFKVSIALSILFGIIFTFLIVNFNTQLGIGTEHVVLFYSLTPFILFGALMHISHGALIGLQKFKQMFYSNIFGNISRILLTFALLYLLYETMGAAIGFISWLVIAGIIATYYIIRSVPGKKNNIDKKEILNYGTFAMLFGIMFFILSQGPMLYLSLLSDLESVAFFRVAVLFGTVIHLVVTTMMPGLAPSVSNYWSEGRKENVKTLLEMALKYTAILVLPLTIIIVSFPKFIINLIYNAQYLPAIPYLYSYLIGSVLWSVFFLIAYFFYYSDEPKKFLYLATISAILITTLSVILIPMYGGSAASDSFLISQIITVAIGIFWARKKFDISLNKFAQVSFSTILFLLIIQSARYYFTDIAYVILLTILGLVIYTISLLKLKTFDRNDIKFLDTIPDYPLISYFKSKFRHLIEKRL